MCLAVLLAAANELWIFEMVGGVPAMVRGVASATRTVRAAPVCSNALPWSFANRALLSSSLPASSVRRPSLDALLWGAEGRASKRRAAGDPPVHKGRHCKRRARRTRLFFDGLMALWWLCVCGAV